MRSLTIEVYLHISVAVAVKAVLNDSPFLAKLWIYQMVRVIGAEHELGVPSGSIEHQLTRWRADK